MSTCTRSTGQPLEKPLVADTEPCTVRLVTGMFAHRVAADIRSEARGFICLAGGTGRRAVPMVRSSSRTSRRWGASCDAMRVPEFQIIAHQAANLPATDRK